MTVRSVTLFRAPLPLSRPYHTSFGDLPFFDAVIARVETVDGLGWGESTAVPGYSWETPDDVWNFALMHAPGLVGKSVSDGFALLQKKVAASPFGATPLLCALEEAHAGVKGGSLPLAAILNVNDSEDIIPEVERLLAAGYQTIKFKIGFNVDEDIKRTRLALSAIENRAKLRLDANQHYSLADAGKFASSIPAENVELLEQPFAAHDWKSMAVFSADCPLPLMLDESIYGMEDIERAAGLNCCAYLKLKLCKAGSMEELLRQGLLVGKHGMKLVIGNGVATDISCRQEIAAAAMLANMGVTVAAGEMNGFLKQKSQLFPDSLAVSGENATIAFSAPNGNSSTLEKWTKEKKEFKQ